MDVFSAEGDTAGDTYTITYVTRHIGFCVNTTQYNQYLQQLMRRTVASNATSVVSSSCTAVASVGIIRLPVGTLQLVVEPTYNKSTRSKGSAQAAGCPPRGCAALSEISAVVRLGLQGSCTERKVQADAAVAALASGCLVKVSAAAGASVATGVSARGSTLPTCQSSLALPPAAPSRICCACPPIPPIVPINVIISPSGAAGFPIRSDNASAFAYLGSGNGLSPPEVYYAYHAGNLTLKTPISPGQTLVMSSSQTGLYCRLLPLLSQPSLQGMRCDVADPSAATVMTYSGYGLTYNGVPLYASLTGGPLVLNSTAPLLQQAPYNQFRPVLQQGEKLHTSCWCLSERVALRGVPGVSNNGYSPCVRGVDQRYGPCVPCRAIMMPLIVP